MNNNLTWESFDNEMRCYFNTKFEKLKNEINKAKES